jgi:hypothetical protein
VVASARAEPPRQESERQIRLNTGNQCLLARGYAWAGFVPVLDYLVVGRQQRLDRYRRALRGLDFHLVVLDPGRVVALQRDRARPEKTVAHHWVHMEAELRREVAGLGMWIDSSTLDVEATVERILRGRAEALLP